MQRDLSAFINDILSGSPYFLGGVQSSSTNTSSLFQAVFEWGACSSRHFREFILSVEPCLRQTVVMSLLPASVFRHDFNGVILDAIDEHLSNLGVALNQDQKNILVQVCVNANRLKHFDSSTARRRSFGIAQLRTRRSLYQAIKDRQGGNCIWCGVPFSTPNVVETLEHFTPKHLGGDPPNGENWALACASCNQGKGDLFSWAASSYAHDYLNRTEFRDPLKISLNHRWSVLVRFGECRSCKRKPLDVELKIVKKIPTGLPIPSNCEAICQECASTENVTTLNVKWADVESQRH